MSSDLKERTITTGDLVDLYDEGGLVTGVVVGIEKGRVRLVTGTGKEIRVTTSRIALRIPGKVALDKASEAASEHAALVSDVASDIDIPSVWDVLVDEPGKRRHEVADLSMLALGDRDAVSLSAMLRALQSQRKYFVRKGDQYESRSREQVEEARKREAAEKAREERRNEFIGLARAAITKGVASSDDASRLDRRVFGDMVADLVELSLVGDEAPSRKSGLSLLDDSGVPAGPPAERAFNLLRLLGIFGEDENLFIHRFGLRSSFDGKVTEAARLAEANGWDADGRLDMTDSFALAIDDEMTTEIDDAIGVVPSPEEGTGAVRVTIHIADPGCFIEPGGVIDEEAMNRGATHYFPDVKLPMLPSAISEEAGSLVSGQDRPAVSFLVTLSGDGEVIRNEIRTTIIRPRARMTYEQADDILEGGSETDEETARMLELLASVCDLLETRRVADGAVIIRAPEVNISLDTEGRPVVTRIDERGRSRRMVSEMMILANSLAAEFCVERGVPAIYRRQPAPVNPVEPMTESQVYDPVAVRVRRRSMRRGEVGVEPGPHYGLGLASYTQITSPIRRYQDLTMQRQIKSFIATGTPVYDAEALARIAATTDETERSAREAERGTDEYWILKFYETQVGETIEGIVLQVDQRRTEVELADTLYSVNITPRPEHEPGMRLSLRIEGSRPRARKLRLNEAAV